MADATLSSEDEEMENPIETAVSRGALFGYCVTFFNYPLRFD